MSDSDTSEASQESGAQSAAAAAQHTVTYTFSVATEGNDRGGRGGLATIRATLPKSLVFERWVHVAGEYDRLGGLSLYVNGTLASSGAQPVFVLFVPVKQAN